MLKRGAGPAERCFKSFPITAVHGLNILEAQNPRSAGLYSQELPECSGCCSPSETVSYFIFIFLYVPTLQRGWDGCGTPG